MRHQIPNIITLFNLFCGCCALVSLLAGQLPEVVWWLAAGFLADALDGQVARSLGVSSPLGAQLDSLADMVSFGVVPGAIFYTLLLRSEGITKPAAELVFAAVPAFLLTIFAAYRLAKFNIDKRQTAGFLGLATPACTAFTAGLLLIYTNNAGGFRETMTNATFLYSLVIILSFLMVSEIPMFNFRFANMNWVGNEIRFIFFVGLILILIFTRVGFPTLAVVWYVALSIFQNILKKIIV